MSRGIYVNEIDAKWTRLDLWRYFKSRSRRIDFLLHPLCGDPRRAFVSFLSSKDSLSCSKQSHHKANLIVSLAPRYELASCVLSTAADHLTDALLTDISRSLAIHSIDRRDLHTTLIGASLIQVKSLLSLLNISTMGGRESTLIADFRRTGSFRSSSRSSTPSSHRTTPECQAIQLVFDNSVLGYINKYHLDEIKELEVEYRVRYDFQTHDKELCIAHIVPARKHRPDQTDPSKLAFIRLYKSIEVVKKLILFDCDLNSTELLAEVHRVFPCLYCELRQSTDRNEIKILFVGKHFCIRKCAEWLERSNRRSSIGSRNTFNTSDLNVLHLTLTYDDLRGYKYVSACCSLRTSKDCDENTAPISHRVAAALAEVMNIRRHAVYICDNDSSMDDDISVLMPPDDCFNKYDNATLRNLLTAYNQHYENKTNLQLTSYKDHLTDELILEGRLQIHWGVRCIIQFKQTELVMSPLQPKTPEPLTTMTLKRKKLPRAEDPRRLSMINGHVFRKETSNFMPTKDSVTCVTANTTHTPQDIIDHLLAKFKVENRSTDFCLCKVLSTGETRILSTTDHPLLERVISGPLDDNAMLFIMDWSNVQDISEKVAPYCRLPDTMLTGFLAKFKQEEESERLEIMSRYDRFRSGIDELIKKKQLTRE